MMKNAKEPRAIEMVDIDRLVPHDRNARTHSRRQMVAISKSIERFGFLHPVLATGANEIIAGHGRVAAAKLLGWKEVPVLRCDHMSDDERRAFILGNNSLALKIEPEE